MEVAVPSLEAPSMAAWSLDTNHLESSEVDRAVTEHSANSSSLDSESDSSNYETLVNNKNERHNFEALENSPDTINKQQYPRPLLRSSSDLGRRAILEARRRRSRNQKRANNARRSSWPRESLPERHGKTRLNSLSRSKHEHEFKEAVEQDHWSHYEHPADAGHHSYWVKFLARLDNNIYEQNASWRTNEISTGRELPEREGRSGSNSRRTVKPRGDSVESILKWANSDTVVGYANKNFAVELGLEVEAALSRSALQCAQPPSTLEECGFGCDLQGVCIDSNLPRPSGHAAWNVSEAEATAPPTKFYSPISKHQTRLLRLLPGAFGDEIRIELLTVDLLRTSGGFLPRQQVWVPYEAVSYCWGTALATHKILCDEAAFPVTANVFHALARLRYRQVARHLWLDAVCINQGDFGERSAQVGSMLSIFKKASRVIVWLGDDSSGIRLVLRSIQSMPIWRPMQVCNKHIDGLVAALREFTQHAYFRRVWVKQEVWAAEDLVVMSADLAVSWDDFTSAADWVEALVPSYPSLASYRENLQAFVRPTVAERLRLTLRELPDSAGHSDADIVAVLTRTASSDCSDPRDHVYGILGMTATNLTSKWIPHLIVDYHKSISEVYEDVVRYVMARDQNLDILLLDGAYGGLIEGSRLPSWCPDFSTARQRREWLEPIKYDDAATTCPIYQLSGSGMAVLRMEGILIATLDFSAVPASFETNSVSFNILSGELLERTISHQCNPRIAGNHPVSLSLPSGWIAHDLLVLGRLTGIPHVLRRRNDGLYSYIGSAYLYTAEGGKSHVLSPRNDHYTYVGATYSHADEGGIFTRTKHMESLRDVSVGWSDWLLV
ncbi:hypothetical protein LTR56_007441 [Elasticomyces elasticus]|nr:hypothetical protein LTR56_007441 [Elasticomyces elasticus]KAK3668020.1 hypothetical protein LTR22_001087 [Elasticomyces elasticus]KAK4925168.1 hypothetical protein LTR49_007705 [Elasticomyces elasticus]KAK5767660.1 hypothetical protein LTS12_002161 [Elasticomyces elasticus]